MLNGACRLAFIIVTTILVFSPPSLTHRGRKNMAAILQTTFSNLLSYINIFIFWSKSNWFISEDPNQEQAVIGSDYGLEPYRQQAITWMITCGHGGLGLNPYVKSLCCMSPLKTVFFKQTDNRNQTNVVPFRYLDTYGLPILWHFYQQWKLPYMPYYIIFHSVELFIWTQPKPLPCL